MSSDSSKPTPPPGTHPGGPFPSTCWSVIVACQDPSQSQLRNRLEELCNRYWPPVYLYIRRNWHPNPEDAKDLCQAYFLQFLEKDFLDSVDASKGRFRSFVCASLRHFLSKHKRDAGRQKRSPSQGPLLSMDALGGLDSNFDVPDDSTDEVEPDAQFLSDWKKCVVRNVVDRMRIRALGSGKSTQVEVFARYRIEHDGDDKPARPQLAEHFDITLPQVNYALKWGQQEFIRILKEELRDQVSTEEDFHAEARELFGI